MSKFKSPRSFFWPKITVLFFFLFSASGFQAFDRNQSKEPIFLAGAAAVDMQLPDGVPVAGYGGGARRNLTPWKELSPYSHFFKPAVGVKDPIRAKALVLQRGETKMVWISLDLVAASPQFVQTIAARA